MRDLGSGAAFSAAEKASQESVAANEHTSR